MLFRQKESVFKDQIDLPVSDTPHACDILVTLTEIVLSFRGKLGVIDTSTCVPECSAVFP